MNLRTAVFAPLIAIPSLVGADGPSIQGGLWEHSGRMEVPGLGMDLPAVSFTLCIGDRGLDPEDIPLEKGCETDDRSLSGNTIKWNIRCDTAGLVTQGNGEITFDRDSYGGKISFGLEDGQESLGMTEHLEGRRLGDCPKPEGPKKDGNTTGGLGSSDDNRDGFWMAPPRSPSP